MPKTTNNTGGNMKKLPDRSMRGRRRNLEVKEITEMPRSKMMVGSHNNSNINKTVGNGNK